MARLANAEKMGFFATPENVVELVSQWVVPPTAGQPWRALDPCAGEGVALWQLTEALGGEVETWGVELSPTREALAAQVLDQTYNAAWQACRASKESVSLLYLNPPYDTDLDGSDRRLEIEFLRKTLNTLAYGGVLVYVVPQHLLGYNQTARLLAGHFEDLVLRRFPDGEYDHFKQVVVFGRRKKYKTPANEDVAAIREQCTVALEPLAAPTAPWPLAVPEAPRKVKFQRVSVPAAEKIQEAHRNGWPEKLLTALQMPVGEPLDPLVPLKRGHIAMLMSSGLMGNLRVTKHGSTQLVKGRVVKRQVKVKDEDDKTVYKDSYTTTVGICTAEGVRVIQNDLDALTKFMEQYSEEIAAEILKHLPHYNLDPTAAEWEHVSRLGKNREPLKGMEPGLWDSQKHVSIALKRGLRLHGSVLLQGEMGCGKTTMSFAAIEQLDAYPAIIMVPPHLVDKWIREAHEVIPGVQVREIRRIGKLPGDENPPWNGYEVNDVEAFVRDWRAGRLGQKAIAVISETGAKLGSGWNSGVAVRFALPELAYAGQDPRELDASKARTQQRSADRYQAYQQSMKIYRQARATLQQHAKAGCATAAERQRVARLRQETLAQCEKYPVGPDTGQVYAGKRGAVGSFRTFQRRALVDHRAVCGWARDEQGRKLLDEHGQPTWVWDLEDEHAPQLHSPLFQFGEVEAGRGISFFCGPEAPLPESTQKGKGKAKKTLRRWPLADYIRQRHPDFFKMLVADECHQYRSKTADRALAFHQLVQATQYQLAMTGTVYGGKSSSVFYLFHRLFAKVRQEFRFDEERRWIERYGVLETTKFHDQDSNEEEAEYGAFNARQRSAGRGVERPGVSPAILNQIINYSIFLTLKDLGIPLPPYTEEAVILEMEEAHRQQYSRMADRLKSMARDDPRWLSTWLQWSLGRPNSAFRDEVVIKEYRDEDDKVLRRAQFMELPAVAQALTGDGSDEESKAVAVTAETIVSDDAAAEKPQYLPKEQWLIDYVRSEKQAGRKVIVYVRQTGTRDIQQRVQALLKTAGLQAGILRSTVNTRRREKWIRRHADELDVLICNPKLVETGLDLVEFCTIVFYEITYSLYTLQQAMRRVWRPKQEQAVKVVFTAYARTIEDTALRVMGQKMKSAQLLYGDEVGGAIVEEDDGDLLMEIARAELEGKELPDFQSMFQQSQQTTTSPLGSPTATSPQLHVANTTRRKFEEKLQQRHAEELEKKRQREQQRAARRRKRREQKLAAVGAAQPSFMSTMLSLESEESDVVDTAVVHSSSAAALIDPQDTMVAVLPTLGDSGGPEPANLLVDDGFTVIHQYTRAQALADGVLIDVSATAREAGFVYPVAVTAGVMALVENIPPSKQTYQSVAGRLWDVVWMARCAIKPPQIQGLPTVDTPDHAENVLLYSLILHHGRQTYAQLKVVVGSGDDYEPVITIMLPEED